MAKAPSTKQSKQWKKHSLLLHLPLPTPSSSPAKATCPDAAASSLTLTTIIGTAGTASYPRVQPQPFHPPLTSHLHWEPAREPLHHDIDASKVCGVGPGMAFANTLIHRSYGGAGATVGLVPFAVGGTEIKEWARGERLYEDMVRRTRASIQGAEGKIMAVLWYQGDSDTIRESDAAAYRGRMEQLICNLRDDLGSTTLPIIQVAIASGDQKHIDKVREAHLGIQIPGVVCVDA